MSGAFSSALSLPVWSGDVAECSLDWALLATAQGAKRATDVAESLERACRAPHAVLLVLKNPAAVLILSLRVVCRCRTLVVAAKTSACAALRFRAGGAQGQGYACRGLPRPWGG
jgi:hypothetical protein